MFNLLKLSTRHSSDRIIFDVNFKYLPDHRFDHITCDCLYWFATSIHSRMPCLFLSNVELLLWHWPADGAPAPRPGPVRWPGRARSGPSCTPRLPPYLYQGLRAWAQSPRARAAQCRPGVKSRIGRLSSEWPGDARGQCDWAGPPGHWVGPRTGFPALNSAIPSPRPGPPVQPLNRPACCVLKFLRAAGFP